MRLKTCMNEACGVTVSSDWKIGWELKSGGVATLCVSCGIAYDNFTFCNIFHKTENGWRRCRNCGMHVHCGCPASKRQIEILDFGGVRCINCAKHIDTNTVFASTSNPSQVDVETGTKRKCLTEILQTRAGLDVGSSQKVLKTQKSQASDQKNNTNLSFVKPPAIIQSTTSQARYHQHRPRAMAGRGRSHTLHHYRPRATQQELQQISENLKSSIVPLFEKVLSATDVGRMDRLVLPKNCTEAYFPPVNGSEGLPIKILDVKGKEWTFLFRFWLNNASRMYVLEGIYSFIKSMELQAGDTVTFSSLHPSGKLVMGFRKSTRHPDTSIVQAQCSSSMETAMNGAKDRAIEPPVMEKTAMVTTKPSASFSWAPNEMNPKGKETLNEGCKRGIISECTKNKDFEHSGLDILATTALLTENMENLVEPDQVIATQKQPQLPSS